MKEPRFHDRAFAFVLLLFCVQMVVMNAHRIYSPGFSLRSKVETGTTHSVTDHGYYVTEDWEPTCAQIEKWKDYTYTPTLPRGYVVHIWGRFEDDRAHVFGTLKDAEQYVELNWCKP